MKKNRATAIDLCNRTLKLTNLVANSQVDYLHLTNEIFSWKNECLDKLVIFVKELVPATNRKVVVKKSLIPNDFPNWFTLDIWPLAIKIWGPAKFYSTQRFEHVHKSLRSLVKFSNHFNLAKDIITRSTRLNQISFDFSTDLEEQLVDETPERLRFIASKSTFSLPNTLETHIKNFFSDCEIYSILNSRHVGSIRGLPGFSRDISIAAIDKIPLQKNRKKIGELIVTTASEIENRVVINEVQSLYSFEVRFKHANEQMKLESYLFLKLRILASNPYVSGKYFKTNKYKWVHSGCITGVIRGLVHYKPLEEDESFWIGSPTLDPICPIELQIQPDHQIPMIIDIPND